MQMLLLQEPVGAHVLKSPCKATIHFELPNNCNRLGDDEKRPEDEHIEDMVGHPVVSYRGCTSRIIRQTFFSAGFTVAKSKAKKFNVCWAGPKNTKFIKRLSYGQIVNHMAGQECLTRKDSLALTLRAMHERFPELYSFTPASFVMPEEATFLRQD